MRRVLLSACVLLGCQGAVSEATPVTPEPAASPRVPELSAVEAEPASEPASDPVADALAIFEATGVELGRVYGDDEQTLADAGLTPALAVDALGVLALRCKDRRTPTCGHSGDEKLLREALSAWVRGRVDLTAAPVLLRLSHYGDWMAGMALDDALTARMQATLRPCAAPSEAEIAAVRADLSSFVVLEHRRGRLQGRAATEAELDDLAYFLAAVADNGGPPGERVDTLRSGVALTEAEKTERTRLLETYEGAVGSGDHALTLQAGSDYLHLLGYPGPIDLSREEEMFWGGAVFSYVMRDVALAAELEGQPALAADLYRRANPGGGACGTSVGGRQADQLMGLVRSEEARGQCRAVVAERMINQEGEADSAYGPARLIEAGYDLERLYRGAMVTRHRELEPAEVGAAIGRAPQSVREAGLARLTARGPEAWERRVWATEGLVAELGRPGADFLQPLVEHAAPELRVRMISAIGRGAERSYMGTCNDSSWGSLGLSGSSLWSRAVPKFGHDCKTWLTDDEANAMAQWLLPHLRGDDPTVRDAAAEALGSIAAPRARRPLARALRRAKAEQARCEATQGEEDYGECWPFSNVVVSTEAALEALAEAKQTAAEWAAEE